MALFQKPSHQSATRELAAKRLTNIPNKPTIFPVHRDLVFRPVAGPCGEAVRHITDGGQPSGGTRPGRNDHPAGRLLFSPVFDAKDVSGGHMSAAADKNIVEGQHVLPIVETHARQSHLTNLCTVLDGSLDCLSSLRNLERKQNPVNAAGIRIHRNDRHVADIFCRVGDKTILPHHDNRHTSTKIKRGKILPLDEFQRIPQVKFGLESVKRLALREVFLLVFGEGRFACLNAGWGALRICRCYAALVSVVAKALFVRTCQCFDL